jgi:hypothetical protein
MAKKILWINFKQFFYLTNIFKYHINNILNENSFIDFNLFSNTIKLFSTYIIINKVIFN